MIRVGITGQSGFVGTHLFETLGRYPDTFERINFEDAFFADESNLRAFVRRCDVIVHLAAMMRSHVEGEVYQVNMRLIHQLIDAMEAESVTPCLLFSSSIQEGNGSEYGRCKQEGRAALEAWARVHQTGYVGLVFPNLFGPGARPNSHSFIATFCYKLTHGEEPQVLIDKSVPLKYIQGVVNEIVDIIIIIGSSKSIMTVEFKPDYELTVSQVLNILNGFKKGLLPTNKLERDLYITFESYKYY